MVPFLLFAKFLLCNCQQFFLAHGGKHLHYLAAFKGGVNKLVRLLGL